jgi:hypothetical protein
MPARLKVVAGQDAGTEFWIEDEVVRIGSDAQCGVRLRAPGLPAHAATLEFRDGVYSLHCRSNQPLVLNGKVLAVWQSATWPANRDLELNGQVVLKLLIDGDPAPARRSKPAPVLPEEEDTTEAKAGESPPAKAKDSRTPLQLLIIAIIIVALAVVLFADTGGESDRAKAPTESDRFTDLVAALVKAEDKARAEEKPDSHLPGYFAELRRELQEARIAELRGDGKKSISYYSYVRDNLFRKKSQGEALTKEEMQTWDFVIDHLQSQGVAKKSLK